MTSDHLWRCPKCKARYDRELAERLKAADLDCRQCGAPLRSFLPPEGRTDGEDA